MHSEEQEAQRRHLLTLAEKLPDASGVYVMRDAESRVLYVGKAARLRRRVSDYFRSRTGDGRAFIPELVATASEIETILTASEKEALILERELIRTWKPRFNVIWRDDKQYLCLRVDTEHEYPWVEVVRAFEDDGARYFGPFHSASSARRMLRVVNRQFQLRTCRDSVLYNRKRPCLEYEIGRCPAPCVREIDRSAYAQSVRDVLAFLEGRGGELAAGLEQRMRAASERHAYELAARYRDQMRAVISATERQRVVLNGREDVDVFAVHRSPEYLAVCIVEVRGGRMHDVSRSRFEGVVDDGRDTAAAIVYGHYAERKMRGIGPPRTVLVNWDPAGSGLEAALTEVRQGAVRVVRPVRGEKRDLIAFAERNAEGYVEHEAQALSAPSYREAEAWLSKAAELRPPIRRLECIDISNLGDEDIVASCVCFIDGQPAKRHYRRYRIRDNLSQDDFAAMHEVVGRRLDRGHKESDLPDLLVVDGGRGQLEAALRARDERELDGPPIVALAKDRGDANRPERLFLPGRAAPVPLPPRGPAFRLMVQLRDEAHRFAITFQRLRRQKRALRSGLEDIPGVGRARRKSLIAAFGSVPGVAAASVEQLARVPGVGTELAQAIHRHFHRDAAE